MAAEIFMAIGGTGLAAAVLGATIVKSVRQSAFLYANARIAARSSYILDENKLNTLSASSSLPHLIDQLKDTEYSSYLEPIDKENIIEFSAMLEKSLINSIMDIREMSPKKFTGIFKIFAKYFEAKIIKTFFRSRFSNVAIGKALLSQIGLINPILMKHLEDSKTIADMGVVLRDTDYGILFEKEFTLIEEFDLEIEKKVNEDVDKIIIRMRIDDKKIIKQIFRQRAEIKNILALLKFKIRKNDSKVPQSLIKIENMEVQALIDAPDIKSFAEKFEKTEYNEAVRQGYAEFEKHGTYYGFERELLRHHYKFVKENELSHSIGPYPIIVYITKKEFEHRNLLIIAKGITSGLAAEKIKRMLV